ncbi:putative major facilitator, sugar transporter, major facilitator superfamily [Rosa chinensis]|uniref:Putative major facilitator, sugar transporter, major facilitator superfamily n=1 Tax=Rosa chinensis TaxID=74649 RepID=A0A2P6SL97_ROSCH|nr:putative major facilitator, sugar transporter, major facilitator superfamily [Rosa chinensis]
MHYSPTIVQFAGFASNQTALALSLITSGLNVIGTVISMRFVDRYGRRKLMIISMVGIITCLVVLPVVFFQAAAHAPRIGNLESTHFGSNSTCPAYVSAPNPASWYCMTCLKAQCGFCANCVSAYAPGACVASNDGLKKACAGEHCVWYTKGCPSKVGFFAVILLGLYIIIYALGMGTKPWIVNSEIYPLRFRGTCGAVEGLLQ